MLRAILLVVVLDLFWGVNRSRAGDARRPVRTEPHPTALERRSYASERSVARLPPPEMAGWTTITSIGTKRLVRENFVLIFCLFMAGCFDA
jgi:hypothetical protein